MPADSRWNIRTQRRTSSASGRNCRYHPATGFRYETLTDDPVVRKQVDDILYDLYGEENPRPLEDYENAPQEGMTMGGISL